MKKIKVLLAMLFERNEVKRVHRVILSFEFSASQIAEGVVKRTHPPASLNDMKKGEKGVDLVKKRVFLEKVLTYV